MLSKATLKVIQSFIKRKPASAGLFSSNGKELRYYNWRIARHHPTDNLIIWDDRNYSPEDLLVVTQVKSVIRLGI